MLVFKCFGFFFFKATHGHDISFYAGLLLQCCFTFDDMYMM